MSDDVNGAGTPPANEPRRLGDRYELAEVIGRGGMAEVFAGQDLRLGRRVAVKLLRTDLARDPSFHARFRREAQASASLNHPNIVAVYDTGETDVAGTAVPYIVMEFVDGTTLRDLVKSGHQFQPERALEISEGVLAALEYSHRHGIIHRDIKPGNVMLNRAGQVKVMDFGIARAIADSAATMTQTSAVLGTAQYLSPEQARGEVVDARSDVYSTGCLLYELLTGRPPFIGDSPVSVAYQHVRETAAPPSRVNPEVPAACDAVVMHALAKSPVDRYQSAEAMAEDVERARLGQPVVGGAVGLAGAGIAAAGAAGALAAGDDATQLIAMTPPPTPVGRAVPPAPTNSSRTWWYVALGVAVAAALALAFFIGHGIFAGTNDNIVVPDLTGLTHADVVRQLQERNLSLGVENSVTSDKPINTVIAQDPAADSKVATNAVVDVTYSSGPGAVAVPTLVGLTQQQAVDAIVAAGLTTGPITQKSQPGAPAGTVVDSNPKSGVSVAKGTAVSLVVSSGLVPVPNVVGETEIQAKADLANAGFIPAVISLTTSGAPAGTVVSQNPAAGKPFGQNKTVTITVAVAPPPTQTPTPSNTASPTTSSSPSP
jgi:eukaryotic-like serine/threonine-protein kinase